MSFLSSRTRSARQGFGKPVLRQEDPRLLAGQGCYSDDFNLPRQAYACMVRSPHAHARIRRIDAAGALQTAGVIAVFTGEDAAADGLRPIPHRPVPANPHEVPLRSRDGSPFFIAPHPPLPVDRARFVGEAVAMVLAEPRAALAVGDEATGRHTLYAGSGGVQRIRSDLAGVLGVPQSAVRVVAREVGGNYGTRNSFYPEFALVAWAARRLRRPVKWTCERREALLTDYQSRDLVSRAELALDAEGNFLAFRGVNTSNVGAHAVSFIPLAKGVAVSTSVYDVPVSCMRGRAVLSHTSPTTPYRAAGRPEVMFVIERLIDLAAHRHGFDRVALRRRNLVPASAMPFRNPLGLLYDSGDYAAAQDRAVALSDWAGFEARRREARRRRRYRGIGLGNYIELNTGMPRERAEITVRPDGRIHVVIGTLSAGQGHETSFAQLTAQRL